jgi:hypothetical protein
MKKIKHIKGIFPAINYVPKFHKFKPQYFYVEFDKDSRYENRDQGDMLKACGISFSPVHASRKNSVMMSYRWYDNEFQVAIYWHNNTDGLKERSRELVGNKFIFAVYHDRVLLINLENKVYIEMSFDEIDILKTGWCRTITPWSGGNTRTKNSHSFKMERSFNMEMIEALKPFNFSENENK